MSARPAGYVAFGWVTGGESLRPRTHNAGVRLSVAHLAPAEQVTPGSSGRPRKPYQAACGQRMKARNGRVEIPDNVEREVLYGERKWCARCWKLVIGS